MRNLKHLLLCFLIMVGIAGIFIFSFSATTDGKLIRTYPLEKYMYQKYDGQGFDGYTFVLAIKQPVEGTRAFVDSTLNVGTAFIRLAKSGKKAWTSYFSYDINLVKEKKMMGKVSIHKDAGHEFTLAKVYKITAQDARDVEEFLWQKYKSKKVYHIANDNSITFALEAAKIARIPKVEIGIVPHKWNFPKSLEENEPLRAEMDLVANNFGYSAADAGEDIKSTGEIVYYKDMPK